MMTAVAWALIHSLWQATMLALVLLSVCLATRSAQIRYLAGVATLVCMLGCFATTVVLFLPEQELVTHQVTGTPLSMSFDAFTPASMPPTANRLSASTPYVASFWLAGVCLTHVWQLAGMISVWRLRRRGVWPAADAWVMQLANLRDRLSISRPVALLESVMVSGPVVIGHLRPVILVPAGMLANLPADQMEAVLLHELAHVRRCDYLVNLFQRWTEMLFFYHPAAWWMSRVVRTERENCCDDIAVTAFGNHYRYVQALAAIEQSRLPQSHPALAASAGPLAGRIHRILQRRAGTEVRGVLSSLILLGATAMLAFAGWQQTQMLPGALAPKPPQANAVELAEPWRKWFEEDVVYIITDAERTAFARLTRDPERQTFITQFWEQRARMGDGKSAKEEHYRRIVYANERFAGTVPGWKTDRGRIYITLGPPAEIESHPQAQTNHAAYEIWRYWPGAGLTGLQSFTFADFAKTGDYQLQTPSTAMGRPLFNRLLRWTVTDALNRYIAGLTQEHFDVLENGFSKSLVYFEGPGSPMAIAVCAGSDVTNISSQPVPGLVQVRSIEDAVRHVSSQRAARKVIINADGCSVPASSTVIPRGIFTVKAESAMVSKTIVEITNQYVGGYISDAPGVNAEVTIRRKPIGLPALEVRGLVQ
jgi:GWxTD domain-containing protein